MTDFANSKAFNFHHFELTTVSQRFLLNVLPFRQPESITALHAFVKEIQRHNFAVPELYAVLLRCLAILDRHTGGRLPSLVDRYLSDSSSIVDAIPAFARQVEDIVRYQGIRDPRVQLAISLITKNYTDSSFSAHSIAIGVGIPLTRFCEIFKRVTARTLSQYIRDIRLDNAAALLSKTNKSIKEVWSAVGYNHASNFNHDFKKRFDLTPLQYRARAADTAIGQQSEPIPLLKFSKQEKDFSVHRASVLVVDDDEDMTATVIYGLERAGYLAIGATSGIAAIQELSRAPVDVVIVDYRLIDMSGLDLVKMIRQDNNVHARVTMFTADWSVLQIESQLRELGGVILLKPCAIEDVVLMVGKLANR